jgi:hypothetical protein
MLVIAAMLLALTGMAYAKQQNELNSPILQVDSMGGNVICFVNNVGNKDVTIVMEIYAEGELHWSSEELLKPNEFSSLGTSGTFRWQLKIIVLSGDKKNVRGIMYGENLDGGWVIVEAR